MAKEKYIRFRIDTHEFMEFKTWIHGLDMTMSDFLRLAIEELISKGYQIDPEQNKKFLKLDLEKERGK